jgi:hypothetical protein
MIPHLFSKHPIPSTLPSELVEFIETLEDIDDKKIIIEKIFYHITTHW